VRELAWIVGIIILAAAGWSAPARGQAEAYVEVRKGETYRIPIAIEDFTWDALDPVVFAGRARAEEVLANDLVYTDAFVVVRDAPESHFSPSLLLDVQGNPVDRAFQARIRGEVGRRRSGLILRGTLLDEGTGKKIFERSYELGWDSERLEADRWGIHQFADAVTFYLTGTRGCAATRIAFVRAEGESRDLYLVDWDGFSVERATHLNTTLLSPFWHPSGRWLAFTSYHEGLPRIFSLDLERGGLEVLADGDTPAAPAFSRDGKYVAYSTTRDGNAEIYVARSDGSRPRRLTVSPAIDTAPSWSPSGRRLVFTSDRWGSPQLYVVHADGGNLQQLTFAGSWNDSPDWSPSGDRIVHACMIDGSFELALIHADGSGWRRLTVGGRCENPRWAPDGRHVIFARSKAGRRDLWILDVDSGSLRRLTRLNGQSYNPAWSYAAKERLCPPNPGG